MKKTMQLMATLLTVCMCFFIQAMVVLTQEQLDYIDTYVKDIDPDPEKKERISFILKIIFTEEDKYVQKLKAAIVNFIDSKKGAVDITGKILLGQYFVTLLRNNQPYEIAASDIYIDSKTKRELEQEIFGEQTWGQWFRSLFVGQQNLYCTMFNRYVKPLLLKVPLSDDKNEQKEFYQRLLEQLFILAQQDASGKCWDDAISFIQDEFAIDKAANCLKAMANSAVINYVTLYQMNQEAAEDEKTYYEFMSMTRSWRYLYFLVTAAQALKNLDNETYENFVDFLPYVINYAGIEWEDKEVTWSDFRPGSETLANYLIKSAIEDTSFINKTKMYLARISTRKIGLALAAGGLATLGWKYKEILKDFGPRKAWEFLSKIGASFMRSSFMRSSNTDVRSSNTGVKVEVFPKQKKERPQE